MWFQYYYQTCISVSDIISVRHDISVIVSAILGLLLDMIAVLLTDIGDIVADVISYDFSVIHL